MPTECTCKVPPFWYEAFETARLGTDARGAEVSLDTCRRCRQIWLVYLIEEPHYGRSGRWWRVVVPPERRGDITLDNARAFIEAQSSGFVGGSFFDSTGKVIAGPIRIK